MKWSRFALAALVSSALLAGDAAAHDGRAFRHHHRAHIGVFIGAPLAFGWYWPPPYRYYPPVVAVPSAPPVYVQRSDAEPPGSEPGWWYHCDDPLGYYPYVGECPGGWRRERPTPPR